MSLAAIDNGNKNYDVGSFDAKTYFAELLRMIQNGATVNITKNGKKVAVMESPKTVSNSKALHAHERILNRSKRLNEQAKKNGFEKITIDEINEAKNYGRK